VLVTILIGAALAVWLALTVLNQFQRGRLIRPIKRRDIFSLIPTWTFFAPRPGVTDYNVLYRDRSEDGRCSHWRELDQICPPATARRVLWNPDKRVRKGTSDMCTAVLRVAPRAAGKQILVNLAYISLLNLVSMKPRTALSQERQFLIARSTGYGASRNPKVLFLSGFHRLDDE
jgi:hypothetical protein